MDPGDKESSFKLLDTFYEAGGNFIDAACNYSTKMICSFRYKTLSYSKPRGNRQRGAHPTCGLDQNSEITCSAVCLVKVAIGEERVRGPRCCACSANLP